MGQCPDDIDQVLGDLVKRIRLEDVAFGGGGVSSSYDGVQLGELDEDVSDNENEKDENEKEALKLAPQSVDGMDRGRGRNVSGVLGAQVRRRLRISKSGSGERTMSIVEYDVFGSCDIDRAEALDLDPESLEERIVFGLENRAEPAKIHFSYDIVLARRNPRVYAWGGNARNLVSKQYRGRPTLIALWSSWSEQSIQVIKHFGEWAQSTWAGRIPFAMINIDNELHMMTDKVKDLHKEYPSHPSFKYDEDSHFWAGYGLEGDWRYSPVGRAFSLDCIPVLVLLNEEGDMVGEAVFLSEENYEQTVFDECILDAQRQLGTKIDSILASLPRVPADYVKNETVFKTIQEQSLWLDSLFQNVSSVSVTLDQVFQPDSTGVPKFQSSQAVQIHLEEKDGDLDDDAQTQFIRELRNKGFRAHTLCSGKPKE